MKNKETLEEALEVPMPIQNKSISSWNKSNTNPNFDGEYLCYISCREECGNVHRYYKVVSNTFNTWVINKNERVALWKELEENPFGSQERSYSEEDVKNAFLDGWQLRDGDLPFPKAKKKWFNKFKNK